MIHAYVLRTVILLLAICKWQPVHASNLCDDAAAFAAQKTGVPLAILRAISLAETGQKFADGPMQPWPWTVHSQKRGYWFQTVEQAAAFTNDLLARGERNIDIGCFQINYHWHGGRFTSVDQMLNPQNNALYAAQFLQKLFTQTDNWRKAVGRYHSNSNANSTLYLGRVEAIYTKYMAPQPLTPRDRATQPSRQPSSRFSLSGAMGPIIAPHQSPGPLIGRHP